VSDRAGLRQPAWGTSTGLSRWVNIQSPFSASASLPRSTTIRPSSFGGSTELLPALEQYHQQRQAASWRVNELNHRLAELPDDTEELEKRLVALLTEEMRVDAAHTATATDTELDLAA